MHFQLYHNFDKKPPNNIIKSQTNRYSNGINTILCLWSQAITWDYSLMTNLFTEIKDQVNGG